MTLLAVVDTETTGMGPRDQVLELAIVTVGYNLVEPPERADGVVTVAPWGNTWEEDQWHTLVRPTVPVTLGARATHHITDAMLAGEMSMEELMGRRGLPELDSATTVFVAQNAEFDVRLLDQSGVAVDNPVICTWRCAQHIWPGAPEGHSNQVLRYMLELDRLYGSLDLEGLPPHRALPDAVVTSRLLMYMLGTHSPEDLVRLTRTPITHQVCRFGKHEGKAWREVARVDPGYLRWIMDQGPKRTVDGVEKGFDEDMRHTVVYWQQHWWRDGPKLV